MRLAGSPGFLLLPRPGGLNSRRRNRGDFRQSLWVAWMWMSGCPRDGDTLRVRRDDESGDSFASKKHEAGASGFGVGVSESIKSDGNREMYSSCFFSTAAMTMKSWTSETSATDETGVSGPDDWEASSS